MPDTGGTKGYEPAPWEAPGKRHTDQIKKPEPPAQPAMQPPTPPAPPPLANPGYLGQPPAAQPEVQRDTVSYHQPPLPAQVSSGQYPPQPQQGAQGQYGAPPQYPPPPQGGPTPYGAYPGQDPGVYMVQAKPSSTFALVSLILLAPAFLFGLVFFVVGGIPFFLIGAIFGALALRETGSSGHKTGRGMALTGTIINSVCLAGAVVALGALFWLVKSTTDSNRERVHTTQDSQLIMQRVRLYEAEKGDLGPGGPQYIRGIRGVVAVQGELKVRDLVSPTELKLNIDSYQLEVNVPGGTAELYYTDDDGVRERIASHPYNTLSFDDFNFD